MSNMKQYDVTIVGGGPVGIYSAFYAGLKGLKVKLVESLNELGGQLMMLYPEKFIYDTPSVKQIKAKDLIEDLKVQMKEFDSNIDILLNNTARELKQVEGGFEITTDDEKFTSKTVLIAGGKGAYLPRRLNSEGEEKFANINYAVKDMKAYAGKNVVIFGGGDSAIDWGNMLIESAKSVTIIHRRNEFRAHEKNVNLFEANGGKIYRSYIATELIGEDSVEKIQIQNFDTKHELTLDCDEVLVFFGSQSSIGPIANWDIEMEKNSILTKGAQKTSMPGVFACGDICDYEGKINTITTGYGESIIAVNAIYKHIHGKVGNIFSSAIVKK